MFGYVADTNFSVQLLTLIRAMICIRILLIAIYSWTYGNDYAYHALTLQVRLPKNS